MYGSAPSRAKYIALLSAELQADLNALSRAKCMARLRAELMAPSRAYCSELSLLLRAELNVWLGFEPSLLLRDELNVDISDMI